MRRGEIVTVNFDPSLGSEAAKTRPAIVVSNDAANATATRLGHGVITAVPVTSDISRIYPFQILLPADQTGLPHDLDRGLAAQLPVHCGLVYTTCTGPIQPAPSVAAICTPAWPGSAAGAITMTVWPAGGLAGGGLPEPGA